MSRKLAGMLLLPTGCSRKGTQITSDRSVLVIHAYVGFPITFEYAHSI